MKKILNSQIPAENTFSNLSVRQQGVAKTLGPCSSGPEVELPFEISRLPVKKTKLYEFDIEWDHGTGFHIDLYLAPPNSKRHWWSLWSQTYEQNTSEGMRNLYPGVPIGYIAAAASDQETDIGKYLLIRVMEAQGHGWADSIDERHLSTTDYYAALLSALDCHQLQKSDIEWIRANRAEIIASAFPEMREIVTKRIDGASSK